MSLLWLVRVRFQDGSDTLDIQWREGDGVAVVLQENRDVGKELLQLALEFFVVKFVDVKKIRFGASFLVVKAVGRGDDELARRLENALDLGQKPLPVF